MNFEEIKEALKELDELTILEVLEISSEDLVEYLEKYIEEHEEFIAEKLQT